MQAKWTNLKAFSVGNYWVTTNPIILYIFSFISHPLCFFILNKVSLLSGSIWVSLLMVIVLYSSVSWVHYLYLCMIFPFKTACSCPSSYNFVKHLSKARVYFLECGYHDLVYNLFWPVVFSQCDLSQNLV